MSIGAYTNNSNNFTINKKYLEDPNNMEEFYDRIIFVMNLTIKAGSSSYWWDSNSDYFSWMLSKISNYLYTNYIESYIALLSNMKNFFSNDEKEKRFRKIVNFDSCFSRLENEIDRILNRNEDLFFYDLYTVGGTRNFKYSDPTCYYLEKFFINNEDKFLKDKDSLELIKQFAMLRDKKFPKTNVCRKLFTYDNLTRLSNEALKSLVLETIKETNTLPHKLSIEMLKRRHCEWIKNSGPAIHNIATEMFCKDSFRLVPEDELQYFLGLLINEKTKPYLTQVFDWIRTIYRNYFPNKDGRNGGDVNAYLKFLDKCKDILDFKVTKITTVTEELEFYSDFSLYTILKFNLYYLREDSSYGVWHSKKVSFRIHDNNSENVRYLLAIWFQILFVKDTSFKSTITDDEIINLTKFIFKGFTKYTAALKREFLDEISCYVGKGENSNFSEDCLKSVVKEMLTALIGNKRLKDQTVTKIFEVKYDGAYCFGLPFETFNDVLFSVEGNERVAPTILLYLLN